MSNQTPHDNQIYWRCRHCKRLVKHIQWEDERWPICVPCAEAAYRQKGTKRDE